MNTERNDNESGLAGIQNYLNWVITFIHTTLYVSMFDLSWEEYLFYTNILLYDDHTSLIVFYNWFTKIIRESEQCTWVTVFSNASWWFYFEDNEIALLQITNFYFASHLCKYLYSSWFSFPRVFIFVSDDSCRHCCPLGSPSSVHPCHHWHSWQWASPLVIEYL